MKYVYNDPLHPETPLPDWAMDPDVIRAVTRPTLNKDEFLDASVFFAVTLFWVEKNIRYHYHDTTMSRRKINEELRIEGLK